MGPSSIPRRTGSPESLPISSGSPSPPIPKRKLSNLFPLFVTFVVMAQIALLGRLDVAKNIVMVDSWTDLLHKSKALALGTVSEDLESLLPETDRAPPSAAASGCEEWLEREDAVTDSRDFDKDPVFVYGSAKGFRHCSVGCDFDSFPLDKEPDAGFGMPQKDGTASVLRSMESSHYYKENDIAVARRKGYDIVMTTSLSSDVPVGYFSWAEYDIMTPVLPKTEKALAAAFITNCAAHNFRLEAFKALGNANVTIDSYGACHRTHDGRKVDKVTTLKRYKFSLAFENSNEEDYVTEKFFQSLVAGSLPVVVGAPNIQDFAPSPNSFLHIKDLNDVQSIADTMRRLSQDPGAYNQSLRWKYEGPSDSFKALFDMGSVHSSCRLCIHVATMIRDKEEKNLKDRPCKCTRGSQTTYHLYVRERGRFDMHSIFLRSGSITLEALESAVLAKFKSLNHVPIWKADRPESIRGGDELKIHRIYPVGMTQRQALYSFRFRGNEDLEAHIERNLCSKFEVIFV